VSKVAVLYFASARDVVGKRRELVEVAAGTTVGEILDRIVREHPGLRQIRESIRISVNREVADSTTLVSDGDEIGVLPPVAGG
jgi:molybdopterin synthase catalytic subunit